MDFVRVVKNSDDLEKLIDLPKGLKNRKVEVIILPYSDTEEATKTVPKSLKGVLSNYKNVDLQEKESDAWSKAVINKYENN